MKNKTLLLLFGIAAFVLFSFHFKQTKPWAVPANYVSMKNSVKSDASSLSDGKSIWIKHCQSCHGKSGAGDGPKAAQLKTQPEDLSSSVIQKQSDGSLFYKTIEGRDDMPSFKKKLPDQDDIWNVVNYMRTFK